MALSSSAMLEETLNLKSFLEQHGIKQILCRIKHPQSNGKIEKWFEIYKNHRAIIVTDFNLKVFAMPR